jgi:hypothetical protein
MDDKIIMKLKGSKLLSNTWNQELDIREDGVYGEILVVGKRTQMLIAYENIAGVNVNRGVLTSTITIINKGGSQNITIKALNKEEAEEAKNLIQSKVLEASKSKQPNHIQQSSPADEIKKLSNLKSKGIITEDEFQAKKKQLLGL